MESIPLTPINGIRSEQYAPGLPVTHYHQEEKRFKKEKTFYFLDRPGELRYLPARKGAATIWDY